MFCFRCSLSSVIFFPFTAISLVHIDISYLWKLSADLQTALQQIGNRITIHPTPTMTTKLNHVVSSASNNLSALKRKKIMIFVHVLRYKLHFPVVTSKTNPRTTLQVQLKYIHLSICCNTYGQGGFNYNMHKQ